jgi:type II secretory pathway pseudopilin PulG
MSLIGLILTLVVVGILLAVGALGSLRDIRIR